MFKLATLGSYLEHKYRLIAHCGGQHGCHHWAYLDIADLAERLGADFDIVERHAEFCSKLKCAKCGGRQVSIRVALPENVLPTR